MDLREIARTHPDHVVGHKEVSKTLNVQRESQRFGINPLEMLIDQIEDKDAIYFKGDIGRYLQAYSWYSMCLKRCLAQISVARRSNTELRYHPRNEKYTMRQKQLAVKQNLIGPYMELDYQNLIIHACILLDRTITISRRFLSGDRLPSFTSFNRHIDFLSKHPNAIGQDYKEYREMLVSSLEWYIIPIKVLRDKYLMHSSEKHMSFFGWGKSTWDLEMLTIIPATLNQDKLLGKVKIISFSPRRLARDIEGFLKWFSEYWQNTC